MKNLISTLLASAVNSLQSQGVLPDDIQPSIQVEIARDKAHGDFASNLAMTLAKAARMKPRDLAEQLIAALPEHEAISGVSIAGPGFINFFQDRPWLAANLDRALTDPRLAIALAQPAQRVVVDYSSPNLAKEMHVGHLRSTIIGDAVVRVLEHLGHEVVRQNHVGDWGTQFGMLLAYLEEQSVDAEAELADLENFYRQAKQRFDASPEFADRARERVVQLQAGDSACLALWERFNRISLGHCQAVYERLGVSLTPADVRGESAYNDKLASIVEALQAKGLLTESQGARCVFLDEFKNAEGNPLPVIIQKAGGGYLYATSDLAAMRYRHEQLHADRVLYFVDQRQALHFQQVFAVARLAGFVPDSMQLEHMGFGTMNGADGKPFKTRDGGTVKLVELLDEAEQRAHQLVSQKNPQLDAQELRQIARAVGIGAVKYAALSKHRSSAYNFNFELMLSFEGNTAPYLMYAYTRVASVFRKLDRSMSSVEDLGPMQLQQPAEVELAAHLAQFAQTLEYVAREGTPHVLCHYLYELAGRFSSFYEQCPILAAAQPAQRDSRLRLAALTGRTLRQGLTLLGIDTLERM
ncbi:MAG: arginine--tRNA ligase [Halopseudomonas sp.]